MGVHDKHRVRLKERFLKYGLDSFDDHTVLEFLLFFSIPIRDTNPTAHNLLNRFGSLSEVFDAPISELLKVEGVGMQSAILIKALPQIAGKYTLSKTSQAFNNILDNSITAGEYLKPYFSGERDEVVYMISLDSKCKILNTKLLFRGSTNSAVISIRKIVETALVNNATRVVIAHNHVSGIALPSMEDRETTMKIKDALAAVDVTLVDHLVMANDDFVSMAESGYI